MTVSSTQIKMARTGLGWTVDELAAKAGVHKNTLIRVEGGKPANKATLRIIQRTLEDAGAVFLDNPGAPAVGIRVTPPPDSDLPPSRE